MRNRPNEAADWVPHVANSVAWMTAAILCLTVVAGCGGAANKYDSTVTSNVLIEGQLVDRGTVTFHPVGGGAPAVGRIRGDGSFSLRIGQGDLREADGGTLPSGEYLITIVVTGEPVPVPDQPDSPPRGGPRLMAEKYAITSTTDLRRKVEPGPNLFQFDLERAAPVEPAESTDGADVSAEAAAEPAADGSAVETESDAKAETNSANEEKKPAEPAGPPAAEPASPSTETEGGSS